MKARTLTTFIATVLVSALLPALGAAQQVEYYHLDAIGSVRAITDEAGDVIARHDYYPYGEEWPETVSADTRLFTGKERDSETNLDYFGARYFGARIGIFVAVDPAMAADDYIVDPQRWNRYAYARGNPLRYIDPDGREIVLTGNTEQALSDLQQTVPLQYRAFIVASQRDDGTMLVHAEFLNGIGSAADSANFQAIRQLANSPAKYEVSTSAVAYFHKNDPEGGRYFVTSDEQVGTLGITVPGELNHRGVNEVLVSRFLSDGERSATLAHEVRHARRYILGLSNTHELVSTSSSPTEMTVGWDPNGAVNRDTRAGYDEARRNSTK